MKPLPLRVKDMLGFKCGKLTVISFSHVNDKGRACWVCECECGERVTAEVKRMVSSRPRPSSCGCARYGGSKTHGMSQHPAYRSWAGMRSRCYSKCNGSYKRYGGRGISVCARWLESFENFWEDMEYSYFDGGTLDREDNEGNYNIENCRWATPEDQANNKRNNVWLDTAHGKQTMAQACRMYGVAIQTVHNRMKRGWKMEELFHRPQSCGKRSRAC